MKKAQCPYCFDGEIIMFEEHPSCNKCHKIVELKSEEKWKMTQQEVYNIFKANKGKWLTSKDIGKILNRHREKLTQSLKRVSKLDNITCRTKNNRGEYEYKCEKDKNDDIL